MTTPDEVHLKLWLDAASSAGPATSNQPAMLMPFQRWFKFKEAFTPSFVAETIKQLPYAPSSCLDPFGGSGTTALTCQFLNISPVTIEVNPFMADVIEAKLSRYDLPKTRYLFRSILRSARKRWRDYRLEDCFPGAPCTFVEPGKTGRWIFSNGVAQAIAAIRNEIEHAAGDRTQRLFRTILGSKLVELSNVLVNGKGRRYRRNWQKRTLVAEDVFTAFHHAAVNALVDIEAFQHRPGKSYTLLRGDARQLIAKCGRADLILTSPPYPNSFDYTDIYNLELWALGYLSSSADNLKLRRQTIRSHVQIAHTTEAVVPASPTLTEAFNLLSSRRKELWNSRIPEMVCNYFSDMESVLKQCRQVLRPGGYSVWAVGDSRYSGVHIDVPRILIEFAEQLGFRHLKTESVRSMRASAQQGGDHVLKESLVWLSS